MNAPHIFNHLDTHTHAGTAAGKAAARKDVATVSHWQQWHNRAAAMEQEPHRTAARAAYRAAYKAQATPSPRPF